jgi:hypothetical protein
MASLILTAAHPFSLLQQLQVAASKWNQFDHGTKTWNSYPKKIENNNPIH